MVPTILKESRQHIRLAYKSAFNFGVWMSGLESLLSEARQKHRVSTEASHPSHLRIREGIPGETWGLEMVFTRVTKEVYLLSADVQDYFRSLWHRSSYVC